MAKKVDLKAKAKRQKILAGVLGVIFLGVAGFQGPKLLKQLTGPKMDPLRAKQAATLATTTTAAPPVPQASGSGSAQLASAPGTSATAIDQLTSFSRFASKDPFAQQVSPNGADATAPVPSVSVTPTDSGGSLTPPAPAKSKRSQPKAAAPIPTGAVISVNGAPAQLIQKDQDFPLAPYDPIFHLVSLSPGAVKIAIAGGSYTSGAPTVTLRKGKPLTLENTADGTRYVLKLLWTGTGAPPANLIPPPASAAATTPSSSPPPAPANSPTPSAPAPTATTTTAGP
ncbi:MAG TPA: hypothetical protein VF101_12565 [Gaiellaceae bacterium]